MMRSGLFVLCCLALVLVIAGLESWGNQGWTTLLAVLLALLCPLMMVFGMGGKHRDGH